MCVQLAKHENNCLPNDYNDKHCNFPIIVNAAKTGPGSKFLDGVLYFGQIPRYFEYAWKTNIWTFEKTV